ncbi:MAG TPA: GIY-YIG nuclease family protein [Rhodanobacter sp.]|nr:GIY-YIG nuclease family protein [Rhodanobacter sp.]
MSTRLGDQARGARKKPPSVSTVLQLPIDRLLAVVVETRIAHPEGARLREVDYPAAPRWRESCCAALDLQQDDEGTLMTEEESTAYPRFAARGRTFVYLLPCLEQDTLKVGFSRNPLQRLHALHRRYFHFFDLDRALLVEVDRLRDARRIERLLINQFAEHRVPPPLVVRESAAGRTEWFGGVAGEAERLLRQLAAEEGLILHAPLRNWLRDRFDEHADVLYEHTLRLLDSIEYEMFNVPGHQQRGQTAAALRHLLDACESLGLDLDALVSSRVLTWYRLT